EPTPTATKPRREIVITRPSRCHTRHRESGYVQDGTPSTSWLASGARQSFAGAGETAGKRFQGWAAVGRPLTMVLGPERGSAGLGGWRSGRAGAATEAAEAVGTIAGGGRGCRGCRAAAIWVQASRQRSLHTAPRRATMGLTWSAAQRRPAPLSRASTTVLLALSTMPLPMGKP